MLFIIDMERNESIDCSYPSRPRSAMVWNLAFMRKENEISNVYYRCRQYQPSACLFIGGLCNFLNHKWIRNVKLFFKEEISKLLRPNKITTTICPEWMSSPLINYGAASLTEAFKWLPNTFSCTLYTPKGGRYVTIASIPKSSDPYTPTKCLSPIAITSYALQLAEHVILRRLKNSVSVPDDSIQFAYKLNRTTLDVQIYLVHYITKSLDTSTYSVRCAFAHPSSAFDSIPPSLLFAN